MAEQDRLLSDCTDLNRYRGFESHPLRQIGLSVKLKGIAKTQRARQSCRALRAGRLLIPTEFYTLEGMMSDPKDTMDWVVNNFSPDMGAYEQDLYDASDTLLLGRTTYELMKNFWPTDLARGFFRASRRA